MKINIAVLEPGEDGAGGYEWRTDREEADKAFRQCRCGAVSYSGTAYLFTDVTVPSNLTSSDQITDWVDNAYWIGGDKGMRSEFGEPTKLFDRSVTKTG